MPIPLHSVWPSLPPPPPAQRGTGTRRFTFDLCQKNQVALWQMLSTTLNWVSSVSECGCTSPCVPLLQASEKTELTMLWERAWPDVAISETPLSDWLEWLDCDSGWWLNKPEKSINFSFVVFYSFIYFTKIRKSSWTDLEGWRNWTLTSWRKKRAKTNHTKPLFFSLPPESWCTAACHTEKQTKQEIDMKEIELK